MEQARAQSSRRAKSRPLGDARWSAGNYEHLAPFLYRRWRRRWYCKRRGRRWVQALDSTNAGRGRTRACRPPHPTIGRYMKGLARGPSRSLSRALRAAASYATAYFSYSAFSRHGGAVEEAIAHLGRGVELNPLSLPLLANRAMLDYFASAKSRLAIGQGDLKSDRRDGTGKWGMAIGAEQREGPTSPSTSGADQPWRLNRK